MKTIIKFFCAIILLAIFFQAGMFVGRQQGEITCRTEYLDSTMKVDSARWNKWDQDDAYFKFQHDSMMKVFRDVIKEK